MTASFETLRRILSSEAYMPSLFRCYVRLPKSDRLFFLRRISWYGRMLIHWFQSSEAFVTPRRCYSVNTQFYYWILGDAWIVLRS